MTLSRKSTIILQFALIICISAIIAGLAGGLTSRVSKWSAEVKQDSKTLGNATIMVEDGNLRLERDGRGTMEHDGGFEGVGRERCRRRERRRIVSGRRYEL
ncbi:hypothetical protein BKA61DRAFT_591255 [Leptodontidium sp. MPI-SDFR-AT-0119]|nr:hypothetical protein BKA61DRAFT_591255 [Leptodontidium sp. MPI-SDFR-AT-0119]